MNAPLTSTAPRTIARHTAPDPLGFDALRALAIERAQAASGELWTDYNLHDPGVSLLEALCFALTEDIFAARQPVPALLGLGEREGLTAWERLGLHDRESLLPCRPVSEADWRLWLLTAGHLPPNPAELLNSQRFKEFIRLLGEHFDSVIIDSPPIMAVTDAAIAASAATGIVFVVGAEMTSRHAARAAIEQLQNGRPRFLGAVLNRVELERNAYYYSSYYRREYAQYYQAAR